MKNIDSSNLSRVLVIEDEQSVTRVFHLCLQDAGFNVATTTSGREALEILKQDQPDAVILDLAIQDGLSGAAVDWLHKGGDKRHVWAARQGFRGRQAEGIKTLLPADFLLSPVLIIKSSYNGKDIGDHLPIEEIERFLE